MKKFLHILITLLFFVATTGFTITQHYCGGELIDTAINAEPESCCDVTDDCCSNHQSFHQYTSQFVIPMNDLENNLQLLTIFLSITDIVLHEINSFETFYNYEANAPPIIISDELIFITQQASLSPPLF